MTPPLQYYQCGICDHVHPWEFHGDCRDDGNRFTVEELPPGVEILSWLDRIEADIDLVSLEAQDL